MAVASNKVIDGEYKGKYVFYLTNKVFIAVKTPVLGSKKRVFLDSSTVANYQIVDYSSDVSLASAMARGAMGKMAAGNVGGIAGAMTAKMHGVNIVLITFKDGKKSLIEIDNYTYEGLKKCCMYNIRIDDNINNYNNFDIHKEIKCPHCKNIAYGAVDEKCPFCNRLYTMSAKSWRIRDIIGVPLLLIFYPAGLIWMWINRSYYLKTRIIITIVCVIITVLGLCLDSGIDEYKNESANIKSKIVTEYII